MIIENDHLVRQCEALVQKVNQIQSELKGLRSPSRTIRNKPKKPYKPYIEKIEKPGFFDFFILYAILAIIPSYIVIKIIMEVEGHWPYLILTAIICFILLGWNYSSKTEEYQKKRKINETKNREYNRQLEYYEIQYSKFEKSEEVYESELETYQVKIRSINRSANPYRRKLGELLQPSLNDSESLLALKNNLRRKYRVWIPDSLQSVKNYTPDQNSIINPKQSKAINYLSDLSSTKRSTIMDALKKVQKVQQSNLSDSEKINRIKDILWTDQSFKTRLVIGGFLGAVFGLAILGTGGVGIAAAGTAVGVWGWFLTSMGGVAVASIITNFEKSK